MPQACLSICSFSLEFAWFFCPCCISSGHVTRKHLLENIRTEHFQCSRRAVVLNGFSTTSPWSNFPLFQARWL